ncbi:hypothetical protein ABE525_04820 [Pseudomonas wadenswilerensis]|uniref:Two pore domain potassium channel family protein n=1 Tax=Pseudomonas wadenswilerensis TaxID=1785161 RepID=A0A380T4Q9_9PSED|nr:hypothetical protein [Pseudomonas]MCE5984095.1 superinfection exclusion B family protein [Pseudomonas sp. LF19]UVM22769.1 superinfection exclusion B family protein [Pseudomonas wadenswilerensis]SPO68622.1 conserved membrane protein of unknown function [Pseudomonas sp. JV241A]SUQ65222.1 hypothetical protein CCOS864_04693 [Pseudomonas wadenswilerensis]
MYESRTDPVISSRQFSYRMMRHGLAACLMLIGSILFGVLGHLYFEPDVPWHDAVFNATLLLGGVGPVILPESIGGKLFFAGYGLYVGLVFVATIGLILAPVAHRLLHRFHFDDADDD